MPALMTCLCHAGDGREYREHDQRDDVQRDDGAGHEETVGEDAEHTNATW